MSYGGSGGSGRIATAGDAALNNPLNGDFLSYNSSTQKWTNSSLQAAIAALPTSASGLTNGALWLDNGYLAIVANGSGGSGGSSQTPAGGVTFSNASTALNASYSVAGSLTASVSLPVYIVMAKNGVEEGSRTTVASSTSSLGVLSPYSTGTYTVRAYDSLSGGTLLAESGAITVSPKSNLISPAFYVSPSGSDSNAGTVSAPFLTLQKAHDMMRSSSTTKTVYVGGGTYSLTTKLTINNSDPNTSYLAYPGETPVIDGGSSLTDLFFLDAGSTGVTIDGLTFQNAVGCALHLNGYNSNGGDGGTITNVIVSNCTFKNIVSNSQSGGNSGAIRGTFATRNNIIRNNLFQNCYGPGTSFVAGSSGEITVGNKFIRNRYLNMNNTGQTDNGAIYFLDRGHNALSSNPTIVDGNYVEDAGSADAIKMLYLDDESSCFVVSNNIMKGTARYAFQLHGSDTVTIKNNIFDLSSLNTSYGAYMAYYQNDQGYTNYGMNNNVFTRNIVFTTTYSQASMWLVTDQTSGAITMPSVSHNLYYNTSGSLPNAGQITDTSPTSANPNFTNPANDDYSFTSQTSADTVGFVPISQSFIGPQ